MPLPSKSLGNMSVLLVDDNLQVIVLTKHMLQEMGITQVYTAKDGSEALDFMSTIGETSIDVVLCDWNMPNTSGLEVLRQIRTVVPDLPFFMITGVSDYKSVMQCKELNVTGYLKKPFSKDQLQKKLEIVALVRSHKNGQIAMTGTR